MSAGPEFTKVEKPLLDQLAGMGWKIVTGSLDFPSVTGRAGFREVIMADELRQALRRINLREGKPWLDDGRISQAVSAIERIGSKRLMEANQESTRLLHEGIDVEGMPGWDQGRARTVRYIDWDQPENNTFKAINQFRVDCPGGMAKAFITPDIVLFVNGIPLVVIECKSPDIPEPIPSAVDQLRRYTNQRKAAGEIKDDEGNERLFYTNQFLVVTSFEEARAGAIGADLEHYLEWKDTAPVPMAEVQDALGVAALSSQHQLAAGMLRPAHLIDIVRHFTLYQQGGGRTIKVVCRYQQFRAVQAAIHRLLHGATKAQDGLHDRRGGIIWHTQGSGKSLTMVFLVRRMRSLPALRRFKIAVVTDRKDLQQQLSETATLTGETVQVGKNVKEVKKLLAKKGPGLVFAMIQKYQERDTGANLGVLNEDESILVLVDEAHRSHASALHAHLLAALPSCARIGFTGTPIIMGARKRTHDIFGEFIDRYTIRESEADGATVPILYEGRTAEGAVSDGRDLDQLFEDMFSEKSPEELERIKRKYATKGKVLESKKLIGAKARDMLAHYVQHILPSGLKAQVVACSRRAAVRYGEALRQARDELVEEARDLDEDTRALDDLALQKKPRKVRAAVHAWRQLALVESLEFAPVISMGDNNDDPAYREWTEAGKIATRIARFKKPLVHDKPSEADPLAFLIVKSMLLTGFDAPIEGAMYLDRSIKEAELLQAIARVNRTGKHKTAGLIIDYYGVARHLKEALSAYSAEDIEGALQDLADEIPKLRDRHQRVIDLLRENGADPEDVDACVDLLEDERLRASFAVRLKQFLATLDVVFPRPEALPYLADAERFGLIYEKVRLRMRGEVPPLAKSVGRKVAKLIDEHVIALGIDPLIPPISITDAEFTEHVNRQASPRAQASEMKHALRHHIRKHLQEDPVHYQRLSERLEEILATIGENWEQLSLALQTFVAEVQRGRQRQDDIDLDPATQAPFFDMLVAERAGEGPGPGADRVWLAGLTVDLVAYMQGEIAIVGFWNNAHAQEVLRGAVFQFLDDHDIVDFERADAVADKLMELARANHHKLVSS